MGLNRHKDLNQNALVDSYDKAITYQELIDFSEKEIHLLFSKRSVVFLISNNEVGSAAFYYACVANKIVPLIIGVDINEQQFLKLKETYQPQYICYPTRFKQKWGSLSGDLIMNSFGIDVCKTNHKPYPIDSDLALLLSTSGSTGSPKLVRHSYENIEANAKNVAKVFDVNNQHRPILFLPLQYTMGLSVLTSHLFSRATIFLTDLGLTDKKFWSYLEASKITNFTGVPFSFDILNKLRFFKKNKYPNLKIISQGGGKLDEELFKTIAKFCNSNNISFVPTYGQTEGTARMCYLSSENTLNKICSIGKPIPQGEAYLIDDKNQMINQPNQAGELVYKGPNVTLGYAENKIDLSKEDEFKGRLYTGDIAKKDEDGFLFIIGRKKRFLKLYGLRISLDIVEHAIKNNFQTDVHCNGDDKQLRVIITDENLKEEIKNFILEFTNLYHKAISVKFRQEIPRTKSGKVRFENGV
ncbi:MAG: AMP-binding protein [Psychroflexus salarius]